MKESEDRKEVLLRLSNEIYDKIKNLADLEFRTVTGEITFILNEYLAKNDRKE